MNHVGMEGGAQGLYKRRHLRAHVICDQFVASIRTVECVMHSSLRR
jgi:hypothetical protein